MKAVLITILFLEPGLRLGEMLVLKWTDIELDAANGKKLGYLFVHQGKSKNARRHVSLTTMAQTMLVNRSLESKPEYVFANYAGKPYLMSSLDDLPQVALGRFAASEGLRDTLVAPHVFDQVQ